VIAPALDSGRQSVIVRMQRRAAAGTPRAFTHSPEPSVMSIRPFLLVTLAIALPCATLTAQATDSVVFRGGGGPISSNVTVPASRTWFITSGTVAPVADSTAPAGSRARFGDTKTQGVGILRVLQRQLAGEGLSLKDVVMLRVYVAPDPTKGGQFDFQGWFDAYAEFFARADNPTRVTRSTVGVAALVRPEFLIEIEAVAVYPKK
jgi:enamine deaminase RidA (YjgF/YER057c/UK114 family)